MGVLPDVRMSALGGSTARRLQSGAGKNGRKTRRKELYGYDEPIHD